MNWSVRRVVRRSKEEEEDRIIVQRSFQFILSPEE